MSADAVQTRDGNRAVHHQAEPFPSDEQGSHPSRNRGEASAEPDVLLDVPVLKVGSIKLQLDDLTAHVALKAEVLDLVKLSVGVDVQLAEVDLDIEGVEAQALLKVRLDHVVSLVDRVLTTIDRNPELVASVGRLVERVGAGAGEALEGVGGAVEDVGAGAQHALVDIGAGAGHATGEVGEGAVQAVAHVGKAAKATVEPLVGDLDGTIANIADTPGHHGRANGHDDQGVVATPPERDGAEDPGPDSATLTTSNDGGPGAVVESAARSDGQTSRTVISELGSAASGIRRWWSARRPPERRHRSSG